MAASVNHVLAQVERWTDSARTIDVADAALLQRYARQRDQAAFAVLVRRHGPMVLRLCRRILGDADMAEDAFQAVFLILARKAHSLKQPDALPAWLYGVARRVALKARSRAKGRISPALCLDEALPDPHPDPLTQLTARELLDLLDEEIGRLPASQRSVVILCCLEGLSREEAARSLGWTPESVKGHLQRGRQRLQERLARRGFSLSAALAMVAVSDGEAAMPPLLRNTVAAVLSGGNGSTASALAQSILKAMFLAKLTGMLALVLTVALAASTTVALVYRGPMAEAPEDEERGRPARLLNGRDSQTPAARTDALGDPLPKGAIARLGTVRFRHGERIDRLIFSADCKQLISKGDDGARIWDTATGKELRHLTPPPGENWTQATDLSADGELLAVVHGQNSAIDFWDVRGGKKIDSFGQGDYSQVCFSPDRKLAAVCAKSSGIELWDLARREKLRSWKAHKWQVWFFTFTSDSGRLLTADPQGVIRLWDVATGEKLQEINVPNYSVMNLFSRPLSPDGKLLAVMEEERPTQPGGALPQMARMSVWDMAAGKRVQDLTCSLKVSADGHAERRFLALMFTADGKRLITSGPDDFLRVWDPLTGEQLRKVPFDARSAQVLALSQDGKTLATAAGMTIRLADWPSGKVHEPPEGPATAFSSTYCAALAPDGRTAVTSSQEKAPLVWEVAAGRVRQRLEKHNNHLTSLQISRDGKTLFCRDENSLQIWDLSRDEERFRVQLSFSYAGAKAQIVTPDNRSLFVADAEGIILRLDAATGKDHSCFHGPPFLWDMACTPDSKSLVGWSGDRKIRIWDVANGHLQHEYPVPKNIKGRTGFVSPKETTSLYPAALSPDGWLLAMGSVRANQEAPKVEPRFTLLFKDLRTGRDLTHCDPLPAAPEVLTFSPDGRMLAWSGSFMDPAIHLLEVASGRERRRLIGHRGRVNTLQFSATGERLLSGSVDTTALVWDLSCDRFRGSTTIADLEALWADLAGEDAARAYQAIQRLAAAPQTAIAFLRKRLRPIPVVEEKRLARLRADLNSDDFAVRQKASDELTAYGEQAIPAYRKALGGKPSLESRRRLDDLLEKAQQTWWAASGERLRSLRAIEAVELAGTAEAHELLERLAAGAAEARLTEEAKAALKRLTGHKRDGSP